MHFIEITKACFRFEVMQIFLSTKKPPMAVLEKKLTAKNKERFFFASKLLSETIKKHQANNETMLLKKSYEKSYRYISTHLNETDNTISLKNSADQSVTSDIRICQMFADEFTKNFSTSIPINVSVSTNSLSRFQKSIDIREVKAVLKDMPNSVSGPDGVPAVVYKRMANF